MLWPYASARLGITARNDGMIVVLPVVFLGLGNDVQIQTFPKLTQSALREILPNCQIEVSAQGQH